LRPILGDKLVENIAIGEISDIMVSMSKQEAETKEHEAEDALSKAKAAAAIKMKEKNAANSKIREASEKKANDRKERRDARKQKKADGIERKRLAKIKREEDELKRLAEEEEAKKRSLDPLLYPVQQWIQSVKQNIEYEDPRYQFGDPIPTTHPGGVHVQIIAAVGIRAADMSMMGKGSSDPFVKVVVGENAAKNDRQIFKTKVIKSTLTPKWDPMEEFDLW